MSSNNQQHRRARRHILFMAILISVFAVATVISSCGDDGRLPKSEQEEYYYYRNAINLAQYNMQYDTAMALSRKFYEVSKNGHSDFFRAQAASAYGQLLVCLDDADKGKKLLDEALSRTSENSDDTLMSVIYNGLGIYEQMRNRNYYAASEYYLKAMEYDRRIGKTELLGGLTNLSAALSAAKDTTGLKYLQEAYEIAKETESSRDMMFVAMRMAEHMQSRGNKEEEMKWSQIYIDNLPPELRLMNENLTRAEMSMRQEKFAEANRFIDIALAAADTTKDVSPAEKEDLLYNKAEILYELGRCDESNQWLDKDSALVSSINNRIQGRSMRLRALNYVKLGNSDKALEYYKKFTDYVEEYANVDRINILKAKEVALDVAQKDDEIMHHKENERRHYWIIGGVLLFSLLLAGLLLYIYSMYRNQRKLMNVVVERAKAHEAKEDERQKQVDSRYTELFKRIKEEVEERQLFRDQNLSRENLAERLGTNRTYLSEAVKTMTGMSFPQYISSLRVTEAEKELNDAEKDVSNFADLGAALGFISLSAFQTSFKKQTGMTLSAYREIARKKTL